MFNFLKNNHKNNKSYIKIAALLIHAARIDEKYTNKEKEIIKKALIKLEFKSQNLNEIIIEAEKIERNSNQILDFTREIKNLDKDSKKKIIETLWSIIYSDEQADMYETNLMRRLSGLLYLDSKTVGDLKEKIKLDLKK